MHKQVVKADVPDAGATFNHCVKYGNMVYISGLPPFDADYSAQLRNARANKLPLPPFPDMPLEKQVRIVMENMKKLIEAAGSHMDCLLKVHVWPKDRSQQEACDTAYKTYCSRREPIPAPTRLQVGRLPRDCGVEV